MKQIFKILTKITLTLLIIITTTKPSPSAIIQLNNLQLKPPIIIGEDTIPLKNIKKSKNFAIEITIKNQKHNFLLDLGATNSMISNHLVKQLKITGKPIPQNRLKLAVAGKCPKIQAKIHTIPQLNLQKIEIKKLNILELNQTLIPDQLSGVIGIDILRNFDLLIDPQNQQLTLYNPRKISPKLAIPLTNKSGVMLTNTYINHQGPFLILLDNAAESFFITPQLANKINIPNNQKKPAQVLGFCGIEKAQLTTLNQVTLGQKTQHNLETVILDSPILSLLKIDGILGQNFLNNYYQYWKFTPQGGWLELQEIQQKQIKNPKTEKPKHNPSKQPPDNNSQTATDMMDSI